MSSLAGALDDSSHSKSYVRPKIEDSIPERAAGDVEMRSPGGHSYTDDERQDRPDEEMTDLFGNDNDVEESKPVVRAVSPSVSGPDSDRLPSPEREHRQALEYEEEEVAPEIAVEVKEAEVAFPNIPVPKGSDGENWVIRMPNFVKVDSKPFHPDTYMGPEHEDEEGQQAESLREKSMTIKLKVENTVRWRWTKDELGQDRRQSNSRIIRWSDGTLSLRLGKELFDINQSLDTSAGVPRQSIGPQTSQTQSQSLSDVPARSQGLTYLVAQHKRSQVLQSEAVITGYMTLRPTGMQSETHRMLVRAVGQKHNKVARLRMAPDPTMDPEREKMELMKLSAKKTKKKAEFEDVLGGGKRRRYSRKTAGRDVWSDDDEDDSAAIFGGSEDEDDVGAGLAGSGRKEKRRGDDDKKGPGDYQEDDFVVADSSDEDAGPRGSGKRRPDGDDVEEDHLDRLDAQIKQQQDAEKRRHRESGAPKGTDEGDQDAEAENEKGEEMDVESEEEDDDEEFKVRRVGGAGSRKRPAVSLGGGDDDDE